MNLPTALAKKIVCGRPVEQLLKEIRAFHTHLAPGMVVGAFMVDYLKELLGEVIIADAIVETKKCLPDAVQLLTPCTIGNGWLRVYDWGKYAIAMYDKYNGAGYRVWLDLKKVEAFPHVANWFFKKVSKKDLPAEILIPAIIEAGRDMFSYASVQVILPPKEVSNIRICPQCGEAYKAELGPICPACAGKAYYKLERR